MPVKLHVLFPPLRALGGCVASTTNSSCHYSHKSHGAQGHANCESPGLPPGWQRGASQDRQGARLMEGLEMRGCLGSQRWGVPTGEMDGGASGGQSACRVLKETGRKACPWGSPFCLEPPPHCHPLCKDGTHPRQGQENPGRPGAPARLHSLQGLPGWRLSLQVSSWLSGWGLHLSPSLTP